MSELAWYPVWHVGTFVATAVALAGIFTWKRWAVWGWFGILVLEIMFAMIFEPVHLPQNLTLPAIRLTSLLHFGLWLFAIGKKWPLFK
jgi:hypothetical protein